MLYNNVIIESTSREAIDGNETRNRVIICEHGLDDIELVSVFIMVGIVNDLFRDFHKMIEVVYIMIFDWYHWYVFGTFSAKNILFLT